MALSTLSRSYPDMDPSKSPPKLTERHTRASHEPRRFKKVQDNQPVPLPEYTSHSGGFSPGGSTTSSSEPPLAVLTTSNTIPATGTWPVQTAISEGPSVGHTPYHKASCSPENSMRGLEELFPEQKLLDDAIDMMRVLSRDAHLSDHIVKYYRNVFNAFESCTVIQGKIAHGTNHDADQESVLEQNRAHINSDLNIKIRLWADLVNIQKLIADILTDIEATADPKILLEAMHSKVSELEGLRLRNSMERLATANNCTNRSPLPTNDGGYSPVRPGAQASDNTTAASRIITPGNSDSHPSAPRGAQTAGNTTATPRTIIATNNTSRLPIHGVTETTDVVTILQRPITPSNEPSRDKENHLMSYTRGVEPMPLWAVNAGVYNASFAERVGYHPLVHGGYYHDAQVPPGARIQLELAKRYPVSTPPILSTLEENILPGNLLQGMFNPQFPFAASLESIQDNQSQADTGWSPEQGQYQGRFIPKDEEMSSDDDLYSDPTLQRSRPVPIISQSPSVSSNVNVAADPEPRPAQPETTQLYSPLITLVPRSSNTEDDVDDDGDLYSVPAPQLQPDVMTAEEQETLFMASIPENEQSNAKDTTPKRLISHVPFEEIARPADNEPKETAPNPDPTPPYTPVRTYAYQTRQPDEDLSVSLDAFPGYCYSCIGHSIDDDDDDDDDESLLNH